MDYVSALFQPAVLTSAGGIVVAIILVYFFYKFASNHVNHNTQATHELSKNTAVNTEVLRGLGASQDRLANAISNIGDILKKN